jgi:hypothetical protein
MFCNTPIVTNFRKCVTGYHIINSSPINEKIWEDINSSIFEKSQISIISKSMGGHLSGMDINSSIGKISNKSAKYNKNQTSFDLSSYRLTIVCNNKECGNIESIIEEISNRKNFDYYSIIVRNEEADKPTIDYDWFMIPSSFNILEPSSYTWQPMIGKQGKQKDKQIGWNTNKINGSSMSITFSMSSQLWIHVEITEEIKKFIVSSVTVNKTAKTDYIKLFDSYNESS